MAPGATSDTIILAAKSASGTCYYIEDDTGASGTGNPGTFYGKQTTSTCSAASPPSGGITAASW